MPLVPSNLASDSRRSLRSAFTLGENEIVYKTELTYLELIRMFGIGGMQLFVAEVIGFSV